MLYTNRLDLLTFLVCNRDYNAADCAEIICRYFGIKNNLKRLDIYAYTLRKYDAMVISDSVFDGHF